MSRKETLHRYLAIEDERRRLDCYKFSCFYAFSPEQYKENKERAGLSSVPDSQIYKAGGGLFGTHDGITNYFAAFAAFDERVKQECEPQIVYLYECVNCGACEDIDNEKEAFQIVKRIYGDGVQVRRLNGCENNK